MRVTKTQRKRRKRDQNAGDQVVISLVWETNAIFMRILGETDESARRALRRSHARGEEREKRILLEWLTFRSRIVLFSHNLEEFPPPSSKNDACHADYAR